MLRWLEGKRQITYIANIFPVAKFCTMRNWNIHIKLVPSSNIKAISLVEELHNIWIQKQEKYTLDETLLDAEHNLDMPWPNDLHMPWPKDLHMPWFKESFIFTIVPIQCRVYKHEMATKWTAIHLLAIFVLTPPEIDTNETAPDILTKPAIT